MLLNCSDCVLKRKRCPILTEVLLDWTGVSLQRNQCDKQTMEDELNDNYDEDELERKAHDYCWLEPLLIMRRAQTNTKTHKQHKPTNGRNEKMFVWQMLIFIVHVSPRFFSQRYPFSIFFQFPNYFCSFTPCEFGRGNNASHGALFWYHDEWGDSVPVDCGLEIKNK